MAMVESAKDIIAPTVARHTNAAISPYSTAVAPLSSRRNRLIDTITAVRSPNGCSDDQSTPAFNELLKPRHTVLLARAPDKVREATSPPTTSYSAMKGRMSPSRLKEWQRVKYRVTINASLMQQLN